MRRCGWGPIASPPVLQKVVVSSRRRPTRVCCCRPRPARGACMASCLQRLDGMPMHGPPSNVLRPCLRAVATAPWRLRPQLVDAQRAPTLYLRDGAQACPPWRLRAVLATRLREQGAGAGAAVFLGLHGLCRRRPDGLRARHRLGATQCHGPGQQRWLPHHAGADPRNNPGRELFWTPAHLTSRRAPGWCRSSRRWTGRGRWRGTLGHDVSIASLIDWWPCATTARRGSSS